MGYTALYRKFRPDTFEDVKGQEHIVQTLKNQINADRIGHAYLFCGTRGTGKTSIAKILAKAVNCEHPVNGSPCNTCATCRSISSGASMNVMEIDAASNNGVDNIREIRESVAYSPTEGKYRVFIIDEAHMLSPGAFNALLKTLEEPPSYVIFILATTEAHKIPITIISRCQRYDFRRISQDTILDRLRELMNAEGIEAEERALRYVAKKGDGSLRDSLSLLDQCIAFYMGETLTYEKVLEVLGAVETEVFRDFLQKILNDDLPAMITGLEKIIMEGRDLTHFVSDFTWYLRDLMLVKASDEMEDVLDMSTENLNQLREDARVIRNDTLMRFIRIFSELSNTIRFAANRRVLVEMALMKMCRPEMERDELSLLERIRKLEKKLEEGYVPAGAVQSSQPIPAFPAEEKQELQAAEQNNYRKAAPEDLQQVRSSWKSIVGETSGMFRIVLSAAEPKFNAQNPEDGRLYVVFADFLAERYLDNPEKKKELEQIIQDRTGKQIEVRFVLAADEGAQRGTLQSIEIAERIKDNINMIIEIEEE